MTQESSPSTNVLGGGVGQQVPISTQDPLSTLHAYLMLSGGAGMHPRPVASTAPLDAQYGNSSTFVSSSSSISSVYDTHRVPGSPSLSQASVGAYSPALFGSDVDASPSAVCKPSSHTPRSAIKSLLADCQNSSANNSPAPSPEIQLEQFFDIKPLLRKVSLPKMLIYKLS